MKVQKGTSASIVSMLGRENHVSRIIETRKSYGNLVGNDHFEDRRGFDDCENCSMGGIPLSYLG